MIKEAKKPYIFVGGGAILSGASEELYTVCKKSGCTGNRFSYGKGSISWNRPVIYRNAWNAWNKNLQSTVSVSVIF